MLGWRARRGDGRGVCHRKSLHVALFLHPCSRLIVKCSLTNSSLVVDQEPRPLVHSLLKALELCVYTSSHGCDLQGQCWLPLSTFIPTTRKKQPAFSVAPPSRIVARFISRKLNVRWSVIADFLKNHRQTLILSYKQLTLWHVYKHAKFSSRRIYFSKNQYSSVFLNKQSRSRSEEKLGRLSLVATRFLKGMNVAGTFISFQVVKEVFDKYHPRDLTTFGQGGYVLNKIVKKIVNHGVFRYWHRMMERGVWCCFVFNC